MQGVFVRFEPDEAREVWAALAELGYKTDAEGMKDFLIDNLFESDEESNENNPLAELIARNPEAVERAGATLINVTRNMLNRFRKPA